MLYGIDILQTYIKSQTTSLFQYTQGLTKNDKFTKTDKDGTLGKIYPKIPVR